MKIIQSLGKYVIVASEVKQTKGNKIHVIDDSRVARGVIIAETPDDSEFCEIDDEVLFLKSAGIPVGNGMPANVVAVPLDELIAILEPEDEGSNNTEN